VVPGRWPVGHRTCVQSAARKQLSRVLSGVIGYRTITAGKSNIYRRRRHTIYAIEQIDWCGCSTGAWGTHGAVQRRGEERGWRMEDGGWRMEDGEKERDRKKTSHVQCLIITLPQYTHPSSHSSWLLMLHNSTTASQTYLKSTQWASL